MESHPDAEQNWTQNFETMTVLYRLFAVLCAVIGLQVVAWALGLSSRLDPTGPAHSPEDGAGSGPPAQVGAYGPSLGPAERTRPP
jgi:hypothetical protein